MTDRPSAEQAARDWCKRLRLPAKHNALPLASLIEQREADLLARVEVEARERFAMAVERDALREALEDASEALAPFMLFQSATKGMKLNWPVVQYGVQSLAKGAFDEALESFNKSQTVLAAIRALTPSAMPKGGR